MVSDFVSQNNLIFLREKQRHGESQAGCSRWNIKEGNQSVVSICLSRAGTKVR